MLADSRIYVAGHGGLVGSALLRRLSGLGCRDVITRSHAQLDLIDQHAVREFFVREKPDLVFLAAAKVGGILANSTFPAEFIYQNLMIQANVIHAAWQSGVKRLLFLGSSCIYPRDCPQPIREDYLLTGPLEPSNRPYALAKIAGIEQCWSYNRQYNTRFLAVMPTNLYGPGDSYDLRNSHVIPALIRKFHLAKLAGQGDLAGIMADEQRHGPIPPEVRGMLGLSPAASAGPSQRPAPCRTIPVWGTGSPRREFLHSDDMADACLFLMDLPDEAFLSLLGRHGRGNDGGAGAPPLVNIGCGQDMTIRELAELIREIVGFPGELVFDRGKPDGTPRKLLDVSLLRSLGWKQRIPLATGIAQAYRDFQMRGSQGEPG